MKTGWQAPGVRAATTLLTLALMVMIFCFSMETAEDSDKRSGVLSGGIISLLYPGYEQMDPAEQQAVYDRVQHVIRKLAHFTEYMMLGFMIRLCLESWFGQRMKRSRVLTLIGFGAGTGYACTDEAHQLAIEGRSGQVTDVLVDAGGVLAGAVLGTLLIRSVNRKIPGTPDGKTAQE
ncbi:MAG: VanZ family protein [Clostridia bacterium]|nr:VanZ family protein [Clostridia bacterium]